MEHVAHAGLDHGQHLDHHGHHELAHQGLEHQQLLEQQAMEHEHHALEHSGKAPPTNEPHEALLVWSRQQLHDFLLALLWVVFGIVQVLGRGDCLVQSHLRR